MNKFKLLMISVALVSSVNALAHGMMTMTVPKDGAMLMAQAEKVELHFKQPMRVMSLKVIASNGVPIPLKLDRKAPAQQHFQLALPNIKPDTYRVEWKALGDDGHVMKGDFSFMQH